MRMHKYFVLCIAVLVLQLAAVLFIGKSVPADARVPIHWNINNEIDGWASKSTAMLPFWLFNLALFLLMMFSEKLFPVFKQNRERYNAIIPPMTFGLVLFFALFHVYMLLLAMYPAWAEKTQFIYVLMGGLFVFLGNILPKTPRNFIAGYKMSWTLYNDEIWRRTHRLGGRCFVAVGLLMMVRGILNVTGVWTNVIMLAGLAVLVFVPMIYAFVLYRKMRSQD